jgi:hypothetical protein
MPNPTPGTCQQLRGLYTKLNKAISDFNDEPESTKKINLKTQITALSTEIQNHPQINSIIEIIDNDVQEIKFSLYEILQKDTKFYTETGIDWVEVPESLLLNEEQRVEAVRIINALCPTGDYENILITYIPEGLADSGEKRQNILEKTTAGYYSKGEKGKKDYWEEDDFKERGGIEGIVDKQTKGRLLITKKTKELENDELFKQTVEKSVEDLTKADEIMQETGLRGLGLSELLVIQRQFYNEDGEHLDEEGWTWITEIETDSSSLVPAVCWDPALAQFYLDADAPANSNRFLGCRLAQSIDI